MIGRWYHFSAAWVIIDSLDEKKLFVNSPPADMEWNSSEHCFAMQCSLENKLFHAWKWFKKALSERAYVWYLVDGKSYLN